jgi:hypothetical protein
MYRHQFPLALGLCCFWIALRCGLQPAPEVMAVFWTLCVIQGVAAVYGSATDILLGRVLALGG